MIVLKTILNYLLGGRPMTFKCLAFTDLVNGHPVNYYQDTFGRQWMAQDRWGWFRVKVRAK